MKHIATFLLVVFTAWGFAQTPPSKENIEKNLDSIHQEGVMLYQYEKASWTTTDLVRADKKLVKKFGGSFSYKENDTIKTIVYDKKKSEIIFECGYYDAFTKPEYTKTESRPFSILESKLLKAKTVISDTIFKSEYDVRYYDDYKFNTVLIPMGDEYKYYILMGTKEANIIPFGNDYVFITDSTFRVKSWHKFHPKIMPLTTKGPNGENLKELSHNHPITEPYISATDVCTFLLYARYYNIFELNVFSTSLNKTITLNWLKDTLLIKE